jgi:hypothetical protein
VHQVCTEEKESGERSLHGGSGRCSGQ